MKKNEEAAAKKKPKTSAAQIRVQKGTHVWSCSPRRVVTHNLIHSPDLTELDLPSTMSTHFPDPADLLNFTLTITPDEGTIGVSRITYIPLNYTFISDDRHVQGRSFCILFRD